LGQATVPRSGSTRTKDTFKSDNAAYIHFPLGAVLESQVEAVSLKGANLDYVNHHRLTPAAV